ncbi:MAG TPA: flagellar protein FlaG [Symbiobacteriaceae bacterium]|jgi:flagellar protein FlaG|nr:flagellar protein FlaG [Symbiobacteriaceae bacterium]
MKVQSATNKINLPLAPVEPKPQDPKQTQPIKPVEPVEAGREGAHVGPDPKSKEPNPSLLDEAVKRMNQAVEAFGRSLEFEVSKENRIVIKVIDKSSGEIIRQIPPDEFLDIFRRMDDTLGLLIDRKA